MICVFKKTNDGWYCLRCKQDSSSQEDRECSGRPTISKKGKSFTLSMLQLIGNAERASLEEKQRRLDICSTCPLLSDNIEGNRSQGVCTACGCFTKYKVKFKAFSCPEGHW
jgi:hypothetical protein